jgi:PIN domain nuclease of toxin-antitoxin system
VRATHVTALAALPDLHRDPFDRMLVAQSMAKGWPRITKDERIRA